MKLKVEIELTNDRFQEPEDGVEEVARILQDVASRLPDPLSVTGGELILHDTNGNWVGYARIDPGTIPEKR